MSKKTEDLERILGGKVGERATRKQDWNTDDARVLSHWEGKDYFKVWVSIPLFIRNTTWKNKTEQNHFQTPFLPLQDKEPSWAHVMRSFLPQGGLSCNNQLTNESKNLSFAPQILSWAPLWLPPTTCQLLSPQIITGGIYQAEHPSQGMAGATAFWTIAPMHWEAGRQFNILGQFHISQLLSKLGYCFED